jgi:hypothetical protein
MPAKSKAKKSAVKRAKAAPKKAAPKKAAPVKAAVKSKPAAIRPSPVKAKAALRAVPPPVKTAVSRTSSTRSTRPSVAWTAGPTGCAS